MAIDTSCLNNELKPKYFKQWLRYKIDFARENPTYFNPDGLVIFVGPQGSGKTLSAVKYVCELMAKYPKSKLVTNIMIKEYPIVTFDQFMHNYNKQVVEAYENNQLSTDDILMFKEKYKMMNTVFPFENEDDLKKYSNDFEGVIFLIDEIQLYLNSLESKNINISVVNELSQQRKQRKHIVATSQVFGRMAKPVREQFSSVVLCSCLFKCLQRNKLMDRDSIEEKSDDQKLQGKVIKQYWLIHRPKDYKNYDTFYKIDKTKFISGELADNSIYQSQERSTT